MSSNGMTSRAPVAAMGQDNDLEALSSLVRELSDALEANQHTTDELCALADMIADRDAFIDDGGDNMEEIGANDDLEGQNERLRAQIRDQKQRNIAAARLVQVANLTMEKFMTLLRPHAHDQTMDTLEIHKKYMEKLKQEQDKTIALSQERAKVETQISALSRALALALQKQRQYDKIEQSIDYVEAFNRAISPLNQGKQAN
uniref:ARAD1A16610p n=1 Tax=Blastobotrys adeninivorans TaxID=409370 RepID=A0A060SYH9_BLAAD